MRVRITQPEAERTEEDIAVFVISRIAGEGADRYAVGGDYYLSEEEQDLLKAVCSLHENVVVIINAGGVMDLSFMDEYANIRALLFAVQPGMEGGTAIADILTGKVTPSGKLTDTWAFRYEDYPSAGTFSHNNGDVDREYYHEGIYVGYRYFDSFEVPVRYGFGFGLSYTRFAMEVQQITADEQGEVTVSVRVSNIGPKYSGREVVQVYAALPDGRLEKEYRRLRHHHQAFCLQQSGGQPDGIGQYSVGAGAAGTVSALVWHCHPGIPAPCHHDQL